MTARPFHSLCLRNKGVQSQLSSGVQNGVGVKMSLDCSQDIHLFSTQVSLHPESEHSADSMMVAYGPAVLEYSLDYIAAKLEKLLRIGRFHYENEVQVGSLGIEM